jgi:hypothetical protein
MSSISISSSSKKIIAGGGGGGGYSFTSSTNTYGNLYSLPYYNFRSLE